MSFASLAGFALVFVTCAWTLSALGGAALAVGRGALDRNGPLVTRRFATAAAIVPLAIAAAVTAALMLQSALGHDHCSMHADHAHLCLAHGTDWVHSPWVVAAISIAGAATLGRLTVFASAVLRSGRGVRALHALSREAGPVRLVETDRAFCFVAGRSIYVSSRVWARLPAPERDALLAHEEAHVANGDLRKRIALELALAFAAPLVGDRVLAAWLAASERLCDARAAEASSADAVASAMVMLFRLGSARPEVTFGLTPAQAELGARVEAVLAGRPLGERVARLVSRIAIAGCTALIVAAAVAAEPLHHAFETLLG